MMNVTAPKRDAPAAMCVQFFLNVIRKNALPYEAAERPYQEWDTSRTRFDYLS